MLTRLKAHRDPEIRTIPVVMLTALGTDHDQARGGIEGAVRYLTKPIAPGDLVNALNEVLAGPPEPEQRKSAQQKGLTSLARIERNAAAATRRRDRSRGRAGSSTRAPRRRWPMSCRPPRPQPWWASSHRSSASSWRR